MSASFHYYAWWIASSYFSRSIDLNAPIHLVSTPDAEARSQSHLLHLVNLAKKGKDGWYLKQGHLTENIFLPENTVEQAKKKINDPEKLKQVLEGAFVMGSKRMFDINKIQELWVEGMVSAKPYEGHQYLMSVDWGGSDTGDPTVMMILDITEKPYKIVYHEEVQGGFAITATGAGKIVER